VSSLPQALADYLRIRRALGFKLDQAERLLAQFVADLHGHNAEVPTIDHALAWATSPTDATSRWWAHRLWTVRGFAAYLHALDARVEVPPPGLLRRGPRRAIPYLYSQADITALIHAAGTLARPLGAATYQTLIGLLAVTGMRVGEAIRLDRDDLHADHDGLLRVRHSKFGKSRLVPLHPSTVAALRTYLQVRDELLPAPASPALLLSTTGTRLGYNNVWRTFHRLVRQVGISARSASCQPRIHDFATASRWPPCWTGTPMAPTCRRCCPGCRPTWATPIPPTPTGTCRPRRSCSRWPHTASTPTWQAGREHPRPDPAGVLHRPAGPPAPRQRPHHRRLPRRVQAAAGLRRTAHRQATLPPGHRRPGRRAHRRVPGPPPTPTRQQRADPQRPPGRCALPVPLRCPAPPPGRRRHPTGAGDPTQTLRPDLITYLTQPETDALLDAPDQATWTGRRDHALLALAIHTGLRVSELTALTLADVHLGTGTHVSCLGKGRKQRSTPLTSGVTAVLHAWLAERAGLPTDPLFPTRRGTPLSPDAVQQRLATHATTAAATCPTLAGKTITPHVLRHTAAMRLLSAGVDTTVIALWLGHEQVATTQVYIHADLALKEQALARTTPAGTTPGRYQPPDAIIAFLESL